MHTKYIVAVLALLLGLSSLYSATAQSDNKESVNELSGRAAPQPITRHGYSYSNAKNNTEKIFSMRVLWEAYPGAAKYEVVVLSTENGLGELKEVFRLKDVFTAGVDIPLISFGPESAGFYWKVRPLGYDGKPIGPYSTPLPFSETGEVDPDAPLPTTQFDKMAYAPEYVVYSWIPMNGAKHHEVRVRKEGAGDVRTYMVGESDYYDEVPFNEAGRYYWRVRSVTPSGQPVSNWSAEVPFDVTGSAPFAALGDSITHGGGAISCPPGYTLYNWETYSSVPVKNLGLSGNTAQEMLDRFESDVLPFAPRVLVIMGGVNDYRAQVYGAGASVVRSLAAIKEKCDLYGIIPVFVTPTPINPLLMPREGIAQPPADWQEHQAYINAWIMKQEHHIDITGPLTDEEGNLRIDLTTDGLHPDYEAKRYMGETIGAYLEQEFPWIVEGR